MIRDIQDLRTQIKLLEREMIYRALALFNGNQLKAAKHLKIPKSTLHDRLKKYRRDEPPQVQIEEHYG